MRIKQFIKNKLTFYYGRKNNCIIEESSFSSELIKNKFANIKGEKEFPILFRNCIINGNVAAKMGTKFFDCKISARGGYR